jgi:hypothetical protein
LRSTESQIDNNYWWYFWNWFGLWNFFWGFKNRLNIISKLKIFRINLRVAKNFFNIFKLIFNL